ncbi:MULTISPECIES: DMT family transporter [Rhizobium/Agrobacterium group]|uniref:DMT family transporter n=2 Tax=Agrobacterium TaxID=357 RepID=A0A1B9TSX9_AGRTU|nr:MULTISPECIES: DMT family transporter [Rhizobium/Agrobacterium group]AHK01903.1 permease of the drug/metabolite transporter (DMT) superfamily [Agrobacterium tumefaciens LBA4213 (Ach5)]AKC07743.1 ABC transporter, membrane spanning protein [Agrobacterium tumefaciens]KQY42378.1 ABC transporter permease [Rhizobium sp. Root491]MBO9109190.1 DMT family transporter [Agrobacterium sp. S2/73]MDP9560781.1 drug/metabolite transporter (DMT)-like permease [Rhizobium nepotum]MDQ1223049.1 drug/metabolite t
MAIQKQMDASEWGMLVALSLLWGGSFFFIGIAVKELPPVTIVTLRVSLAATALLIVCRIMGLHLPRQWAVWRAFFGMGLLNNIIPFCLIVWGQTHIASGLASILNATTPLFTVIVAHFLTADEKMTGNKLAGVLIGFAGVATMIGPAAFGGAISGLWGQIAILGAAISYSFAGIFGRRFKAMGVPPLMTATGQISSSTLMLIPAALLIDKPWTLAMPSLGTWGALIGIALLSTALAYLIFFRILATAGATNLALVTFLIPVSAILLGSLILGEQLEIKHFAGMAMIAAGLAAIDGRLPAKLRDFLRKAPA